MNTITEITISMSDATKTINVANDGTVVILGGRAKKFKDIAECSVQELLTKAKGETEQIAKEEVTAEDFTPKPWDFDGDVQPVQLIENNANDEPENNVAAPEYKYSFDKAVDFLAHCKGEDFLELVRYAKNHNNTFWHCVSEVADVVNADDAYCSALIKLARPLGEAVERKAFELFSVVDESDLCEENFLDMWNALQIISYICG